MFRCSRLKKRFDKLEESLGDPVVLTEHVEEPTLLEHRVLRPVLSRLASLPSQADRLALLAEVEERLDGVVEVETFQGLGVRVVGKVRHSCHFSKLALKIWAAHVLISGPLASVFCSLYIILSQYKELCFT